MKSLAYWDRVLIKDIVNTVKSTLHTKKNGEIKKCRLSNGIKFEAKFFDV
jgi:hypothetical protein